MSEFNEREKGFETGFEISEELKFRIAARTARLFGLWAAAQMGFKDDEAEAYANKIVDLDLTKSGHSGLLEAIAKDLMSKGITFTQHRLTREMEALKFEAREQVMTGR